MMLFVTILTIPFNLFLGLLEEVLEMYTWDTDRADHICDHILHDVRLSITSLELEFEMARRTNLDLIIWSMGTYLALSSVVR
jgi:hypothetical protein